jgi:hypothetical protein
VVGVGLREAQLLEDTPDVLLDCALGDHERGRDPRVQHRELRQASSGFDCNEQALVAERAREPNVDDGEVGLLEDCRTGDTVWNRASLRLRVGLAAPMIDGCSR